MNLIRSIMIFVAACACPLLLSGCLTYETVEFRVSRSHEDGVPNRHVIEYGNLSTDADMESVEDEFRDLLDNVYGEELLLTFMDSKLYVQKRELFFKGGKLHGRMTGITSIIEDGEHLSQNEDGYFVEYKKEKGLPVVLETNGKVTETDKMITIDWPLDSSEQHWKVRENVLDSGDAAQARFAQMARAYLHPLNRFVRWATKGRNPGFFIFKNPPEAE